jgi:hypothetical protein
MAAKPAPKKTDDKKPAPAPAPKAEKPAPKPKPEKAPAPPKDEKNGVTKPRDLTKGTGRIWAIADEITKANGKAGPATRAQVMEKAVAEDINEATVATQYQRWRVYNDIPVTRAPKAEKPAKEAKAKPEKPAKPAPKAA